MTPTLTMFYLVSVVVSAIAFAFAAYLYFWVKRQPQENKRITEVAGLIRDGANTFMRREYKILAIFAAVIAGLHALSSFLHGKQILPYIIKQKSGFDKYTCTKVRFVL